LKARPARVPLSTVLNGQLICIFEMLALSFAQLWQPTHVGGPATILVSNPNGHLVSGQNGIFGSGQVQARHPASKVRATKTGCREEIWKIFASSNPLCVNPPPVMYNVITQRGTRAEEP